MQLVIKIGIHANPDVFVTRWCDIYPPFTDIDLLAQGPYDGDLQDFTFEQVPPGVHLTTFLNGQPIVKKNSPPQPIPFLRKSKFRVMVSSTPYTPPGKALVL